MISSLGPDGKECSCVAGRPRIQRPGESADTATKDMAKDKDPRRLRTYLSDKNYPSTLTPREQAQPLPQIGNIRRRILTTSQ